MPSRMEAGQHPVLVVKNIDASVIDCRREVTNSISALGYVFGLPQITVKPAFRLHSYREPCIKGDCPRSRISIIFK